VRRPSPACAIGIGLLLGCVPVAAEAVASTEPATNRGLMIDIEESLVCQCGCGLTVHACNHLNCPSGIPMKEEIAKRLASGESKEQILAYFRDRYGEKVLSAPTLSGFNLVAWITPFVFFVVGGVVVVRVARRWMRDTEREPAPAAVTAEVDDAYRDRLRREIEEFDR
jgi:cytochrome c-type biogenesis protein CcmH/NrfF